ncbi:family 20 glycosylhydrolase [Leifsonia sp. F6_8S_P_1B]|uniref:beta-N-acetylhexosaminidase n=1 Tax=Leifsonia williamsii TaxID=3035919 RepID=A0ABT8KI04_9MICO|nr:family 20 glycosylhydrolase [Leifsonia williamsii]MDN4616082.1 family 20 glycosylhydrolase [Leifsonia williamsii]
MVVPRPALIEHTAGAPFLLSDTARISVAGAGAADVAGLLAAELAADCGRRPDVVQEPPAFGDIAIVIADHEVPAEHRAEGYTLEVDAGGVRIGAATAAGAFRGVQTLRQLVPADCREDPFTVSPVRVEDHPRYAYRGAMLDVARHFFGVEEVKRFIDAIVLLKVNHLHLHLTDDQGWRIEILSRPELTAVGGRTAVGGAPGGFYTQEQYRDLVAYAAERHVTVVPELDMPGHVNAALVACPELTPDGVAPEPYTGTDVGFSSLLVGHPATERFVREVVREVAALTPGPYLHLGADECLATPHDDYLRFVAFATKEVATAGKTAVGWHELGRSDDLAPGTIGQYWDFVTPRGTSAQEALSFVRQGGAVIVSPADAAYLDIVTAEGEHPGLAWTGRRTTLRSALVWDPARVVPGLADAHILGVEAPLWTETVSTIEEVELMVFPRLAAIAEIGWSPAPADTVDVETARDLDEFAGRLAELAAHWDAAGTVYRRLPGVPWPDPVPEAS